MILVDIDGNIQTAEAENVASGIGDCPGPCLYILICKISRHSGVGVAKVAKSCHKVGAEEGTVLTAWCGNGTDGIFVQKEKRGEQQ